MSGAGGGFAGTVQGSFFKAQPWIDLNSKPGFTKQALPAWSAWLLNALRLRHIFFSPNFVWLTIAAFMYLLMPYDLEAARAWNGGGWVAQRLIFNCTVTYLYYAFWDITLYGLKWSKRKFKDYNWPTKWVFAHDFWYASMGILIWTGMECVFMNLWATGKLPYIADADILASPGNVLRFVFWTAATPLWRGFHFYFAHRFIHVRGLYKYVHCLHHRNIDIEPLAGLCMHPIEHLYYFACIGPSLVCLMSPFHFLWNGVHLLLSPAASHSGWEDHWQTDQFHYLHHAKFECNYGSASMPLDRVFGTFCDQMGSSDVPLSPDAKKPGDDDKKAGSAPPTENRPSLRVTKIPEGFYVYMVYSVSLFVLLACAAAGLYGLDEYPRTVAATFSMSPVLVAFLMLKLTNDRLSIRWPFHKEAIVGAFGLHYVVGFVVSAMPVYCAAASLLGVTEAVPYCYLFGCPAP